MDRDVIVALDFPSKAVAKEFLARFDGEKEKPFVKVGM